MEPTMEIQEQDSTGGKPFTMTKKTLISILVIAILLWIGAVVLWMQVELDKWLLLSHNGLRTNDLVVWVAKGVSGYGMPLIVLVYLFFMVFTFKKEELHDSYRVFLPVIFLFGVAAVGGSLLKEIFDRPRPFIEYADALISFSTANTPAFPSGHAAKSAALALPFLILVAARDAWYTVVKVLLGFIALAVGYSRVVLGAHYVSDVLAGIGLSLFCLPFVNMLTNKILAKMNESKLETATKIWALVLVGLLVFLVVN
jgi:membrane-associated phospholipid phosphatase